MSTCTEYELAYEWQHIYTTRLGILCGTDMPTPDQELIARMEADAAVQEAQSEHVRELKEP